MSELGGESGESSPEIPKRHGKELYPELPSEAKGEAVIKPNTPTTEEEDVANFYSALDDLIKPSEENTESVNNPANQNNPSNTLPKTQNHDLPPTK